MSLNNRMMNIYQTKIYFFFMSFVLALSKKKIKIYEYRCVDLLKNCETTNVQYCTHAVVKFVKRKFIIPIFAYMN